MPSWVSAGFAGLLALVLAAAAVGKLRRPGATVDAVRALGVPAALASAIARSLPAVEVAVAVLLVLPRTRVAGAVAAMVLCSAFTVLVALNLAQGRRPSCGCFGSAGTQPISGRTLVRNATLVAMAVMALP